VEQEKQTHIKYFKCKFIRSSKSKQSLGTIVYKYRYVMTDVL